MPRLVHAKPQFPGDLIQRHQKMLAKGKVHKHGLAEEKAELALMKKGAACSKKSNKSKK